MLKQESESQRQNAGMVIWCETKGNSQSQRPI